MHRFYLPPEQCACSPLFLTGREAHHALRVLRLRRGDTLVVLDGAGREFRCVLDKSDRDKVMLNVEDTRTAPRSACEITLLQAIPKGKLFESIIQKATELGAHRIIPLLSERTVVQMNRKEAASKAAKWQLVAVEAIKQCGSPWLPRVEPPIKPDEFLSRGETFELPLVGSLRNGSRHPKQVFHDFRATHSRNPKTACIWIGPEGDFTDVELESIEAKGAVPITLGPLVLRTETAATYCLSILSYETTL
jgi:16S rRNA (uracil1498-N3)-methyltransferase